MKKNILFLVFYCLAFLVVIANSVYLVLNSAYVDISDVPKGEFVRSYTSPNGDRELKFYFVKTEIGNGVRVSQTRYNKTENIFWQTNVNDINLYWQSNDSVVINGIILNLSKGDTFDSRYMRSIFNDGLMGWDK